MAVVLENGKYVVEIDQSSGKMTFFRNGEPWESAQNEWQYAKFIFLAMIRIEELELKLNGVVKLVDECFCHDPYGGAVLDSLTTTVHKVVSSGDN